MVWEIMEGRFRGSEELRFAGASAPWTVETGSGFPGGAGPDWKPRDISSSWLLSWQRVLTPVPAGCLLGL